MDVSTINAFVLFETEQNTYLSWNSEYSNNPETAIYRNSFPNVFGPTACSEKTASRG
jgi:hypothetical protein